MGTSSTPLHERQERLAVAAPSSSPPRRQLRLQGVGRVVVAVVVVVVVVGRLPLVVVVVVVVGPRGDERAVALELLLLPEVEALEVRRREERAEQVRQPGRAAIRARGPELEARERRRAAERVGDGPEARRAAPRVLDGQVGEARVGPDRARDRRDARRPQPVPGPGRKSHLHTRRFRLFGRASRARGE